MDLNLWNLFQIPYPFVSLSLVNLIEELVSVTMHVLRRLKSFAAGRSATVNEPVSRSIKWDSDNCVFSPWFDNQISLINPISGIRWL